MPRRAGCGVSGRTGSSWSSTDGLAALVKEDLRADPYLGVVYVFRSTRSDRVKLLWWDGSGVVLSAKRYEQQGFRWPRIGAPPCG